MCLNVPERFCSSASWTYDAHRRLGQKSAGSVSIWDTSSVLDLTGRAELQRQSNAVPRPTLEFL